MVSQRGVAVESWRNDSHATVRSGRAFFVVAVFAFVTFSGCVDEVPPPAPLPPDTSAGAFHADFDITGPAFVSFGIAGDPETECSVRFDFTTRLDEKGPIYWIDYPAGPFWIVRTRTDKDTFFFEAGNLVDSSELVPPRPGTVSRLNISIAARPAEEPFVVRAAFRAIEPTGTDSAGAPLEVSVACDGDVTLVDTRFSQTVLLFDEHIAEGGVAMGVAESGVIASATASHLFTFEVDAPHAQLDLMHRTGVGSVVINRPVSRVVPLPPLTITTVEGEGGIWELQIDQGGAVSDVFIGLLAGGQECDCFRTVPGNGTATSGA